MAKLKLSIQTGDYEIVRALKEGAVEPAGNVWIRGILENEYGVDHRTITWVTDRDEERELLGPDPWQYGLSAINIKNLEAMAGYVHQQGMSDRLMTIEELFPKEAFDL